MVLYGHCYRVFGEEAREGIAEADIDRRLPILQASYDPLAIDGSHGFVGATPGENFCWLVVFRQEAVAEAIGLQRVDRHGSISEVDPGGDEDELTARPYPTPA